jgi:hypothetical protein
LPTDPPAARRAPPRLPAPPSQETSLRRGLDRRLTLGGTGRPADIIRLMTITNRNEIVRLLNT